MNTIHFTVVDGVLMFDAEDIGAAFDVDGEAEYVDAATFGAMVCDSDTFDGDSLTLRFERVEEVRELSRSG
jgi:hypothetical protein